MTNQKPFLTKFAHEPILHRLEARDTDREHRQRVSSLLTTEKPRPTSYTFVEAETTDDR